MRVAYLQVFITLFLTIYGQIIIKSRINIYGALPLQFKEKIIFLLRLFIDPYIFSGFLSAIFASLFWMSAMTKLPITRAYPIMSLAPTLVLIFGVLYLGETVTLGKIAGIILIIGGTYLSIKF
jgi:undecaprenyl phosphate-alpha-L-ara4N flippase subunit ArnF